MFKLLKSNTARQTGIVFIGNLVSALLAIAFTIVAARALGPENWGLVAGVGSLASILMAVGDLGISAAVIKFASGEKDSRVAGYLFTLRLFTVLVFFLVILLFSGSLSALAFKPGNTTLVIFAGILFLAFLMLDFEVSLSQARQKWLLSSFILSIANVARILGLIALVYFGSVTLFSILWVFSVLPFLSWFSVLPFQLKKISIDSGLSGIIKKVKSFSLWMALGKIVSTVSSRVDVLLLLNIAGSYQAGIYSAASRLAFGVPLVVGSFAKVIAPKFSYMEKEKLSGYFLKTLGLSLLMVAGIIFGIIISPFIISLFGDKYLDSVRILQWMLVSFIPFALSTPSVNLLIYAFKKPNIMTSMGLIQLPVILAINFLFIPIAGVYAPVIALAFVNLSTLVVTYYLSFEFLKRT